jgi:hypothetical protein
MTLCALVLSDMERGRSRGNVRCPLLGRLPYARLRRIALHARLAITTCVAFGVAVWSTHL